MSDFEAKFEKIKKLLLKSKEEVEQFKTSESAMRLELAAAEKMNFKT